MDDCLEMVVAGSCQPVECEMAAADVLLPVAAVT